MTFHRLSVPSYFGGLPGGYDYVNNATSGTPADADGPRSSGPNAGTYLVGYGEDGRGRVQNRGLKALAQNTDALDDLFHRDLATPRVLTGNTGGSVAASLLLTGSIFLGEPGTPNTVPGIRSFVTLVDDSDDEIFSGTECSVISITGGAPGDVWSTGNITLNISPPIPAGVNYRVYYFERNNLAALERNAFPSQRQYSRYNGGPTWADGVTLNPATTVTNQLDKIVSDLSALTGANLIGASAYTPLGGTYSLSDGTVQGQLDALITDIDHVNTDLLAEVSARIAAISAEAAARVAGDASVSAFIARSQPGLRLSGVSGHPVPPPNVFATVIYYTPFVNGNIGLYDGTKWVDYTTAEISIAVPATANKVYDVFVYSNAGVPTLELSAAWTNDTTRADALVRQDGVWVKGADLTRRYVGSFRRNAGSAPDAVGSRSIWNQYNRVQRSAYTNEASSASTWTYGSNSFRPANNNTDNSVSLLIGDPEGTEVSGVVRGTARGITTNVISGVGIGIDSTTVNSADVFAGGSGNTTLASIAAEMNRQVTVGFHVFTWLEIADGSNTTTFFGSYVSGNGNSGLFIRALM